MPGKTNQTGNQNIMEGMLKKDTQTQDLPFSPDDDLVNEPEDATDDSGDQNGTGEGDVQNQETFTIKFNGKEETLTKEQIIELAQKGKNYDHVFNEKEQLKNSEEMKALARLAKDSGYANTKEFIAALDESAGSSKLQKRISELEDEGYDPKQAKYVAELEMKSAQTQTAQPDPQQAQAEMDGKAFDDLLEAFPEAREFKTLEEYPQEFQDAVANGVKPVVAYAKFVAGKATNDKRVKDQNAAAKARDTGSLKTLESDNQQDPFLAELLK